MTAYSDDFLRTILTSTRTIALVGASPNPERPSHQVLRFLLDRGYVVWPVNPGQAGHQILGQTVYASLDDLPATPDMVDIFRNSTEAALIVRDILTTEKKPAVIWMQLEVVAEEAAHLARAQGIQVVMDRCPKIEYARLGLST